MFFHPFPLVNKIVKSPNKRYVREMHPKQYRLLVGPLGMAGGRDPTEPEHSKRRPLPRNKCNVGRRPTPYNKPTA